MNREIKFRVFQNGKMYYNSDKESIFCTINKMGIISDEGLMFFEGSDEISMQYTGLKDKNGKECYEGDLSIINGNLCEVKFDVYFFSGWCFDIRDRAGAYTFNDHCKHFNDAGCQDFEIIGNIYQKPDKI
jgi:uncharacterized phage protein (TIGR01671 family)